MFSRIQSVFLLTAALQNVASAVVMVRRGADDVCGGKGYDGGNGNYYYDDSSALNTYTACSNQCAQNSTCKSFGIGEACMLFDIPLKGNFNAAKGSKDTYYDIGCLSSSSTSSSMSSAKATTSSSASMSSIKPTSSTKAVTSTSSNAPATSSWATSTKSTSVKAPTTTSSPSTSSSKPAATSASPSSTSSSPPAAVTVPAGCPAPASVELTGLSWFNSTHNLDCPQPNYPAGSQVCFDGTHVCPDEANGVPGGPRVCSCVPFCFTGLPSYAYQPFGYGPPDNITINLNDRAQPSCTAVMPTGFRDFEIGLGHVNCGNAQNTLEFYGDSNKDSSTGTVSYNGYVYASYSACGGVPHYSGSVPLSCTRDAGGNATCGLKSGKATLTLLSFQ